MLKTMIGAMFLILAQTVPGFVIPMTWEKKCGDSDAIVRGVVIDLVLLRKPVLNSRGREGSETTLDHDDNLPGAVAVVKVIEVLKGDRKTLGDTILVPCGYTFDESPAELTKTKEYVLFLDSMGHGYYHPIEPFAMYRIHAGRVSQAGFDTDSDFDKTFNNRETASYEDFAKRIQESLKSATK